MRLLNFLNERYLHGEYKFGFELEAISPVESSYRNIMKHISSIDSIWKNGKVEHDGSIKPDDKNQYGFEYNSPILTLNPLNINKTIKLLEKLKERYYTNRSCGFHIHLSYPNITSKEAFWIICNIAYNDNILNEFNYFDKYGIDFFEEEYANPTFLRQIKKFIEQDNMSKLVQYYSDSKYRLFRIHPQGTIEWRGPRDFIEENGAIKDFFVLLWKLVSHISNALINKSLKNITKSDLFSIIDGDATIDPAFDDEKKPLGKDFQTKNAKMKLIDKKTGYIEWFNGEWLSGHFSDGVWRNGIWHNGTWSKGTWMKGTWKDGHHYAGEWMNGIWENGTWMGGKWKDGTWLDGEWLVGFWYNGTWKKGTFKGNWLNGIWEDGEFVGSWQNGKWLKGRMKNTTWMNGEWMNGYFYRGDWLEGTFYNGMFEEGKWKKGIFKNGMFKKSEWLGGRWESGMWINDSKWIKGIIFSKKFNNHVISSINPNDFYELEKKSEDLNELKDKVR